MPSLQYFSETHSVCANVGGSGFSILYHICQLKHEISRDVQGLH